MDPATLLEHLEATLPGLDVLSTPDVHFVYYDPERSIPADRRQPFATILLTDAGQHTSDTASALAPRGAFRVNVGVGRETYRALFGPEPSWGPGGGVVQTGHDFTQIDTFLPHPIYAPMSWICIVSPSEVSMPQVHAYLREAHALAAARHARSNRGAREA